MTLSIHFCWVGQDSNDYCCVWALSINSPSFDIEVDLASTFLGSWKGTVVATTIHLLRRSYRIACGFDGRKVLLAAATGQGMAVPSAVPFRYVVDIVVQVFQVVHRTSRTEMYSWALKRKMIILKHVFGAPSGVWKCFASFACRACVCCLRTCSTCNWPPQYAQYAGLVTVGSYQTLRLQEAACLDAISIGAIYIFTVQYSNNQYILISHLENFELVDSLLSFTATCVRDLLFKYDYSYYYHINGCVGVCGFRQTRCSTGHFVCVTTVVYSTHLLSILSI